MKLQTGSIASIGEPEDLDDLRIRVHDPVFGNTEPFVEGSLHPAVGRGRSRRQDLDQKSGTPWMFFSVMIEAWDFETKTRSGSATWRGSREKTTS